MPFKSSVSSAMALSLALTVQTIVVAAPALVPLKTEQALQIPGATLPPGEYTLSVEDRLSDRAIVRIASVGNSSNFLVLAAPNPRLANSEQTKFLFYRQGAKEALRGWACPGCSAALEFVYPKQEAAQLSGETGKSVLAADPSYDKLPDNLTPDDMKVVTLWLLSPKRITSDGRGEGLSATKYLVPEDRTNAEIASAAGPQSATGRISHMPKTASNTYLLLLWGGILTSLAFLSWVARRSRRSGQESWDA